MLVVSGLEKDRDKAQARTDAAVTSGKAAALFDRMVIGLGGPPDFVVSHRQHLPVAPVTVAIHAAESGYLTAVDAFQTGSAIIELGGGRRQLGDTLDLAVGLSDVAAVGERVDEERPLAVVHASSEDAVAAARGLLLEACTVAAEPPAVRPVICETMTTD